MTSKKETECVFCAKIETRDYWGRDSETDVIWFEPLNPVTPGHMLFVPWDHVEHNGERAAAAVGSAFEAASRYARNQDYQVYNLITSSGVFATQTVPHVHIHFVPRRKNDGLQLPWGLPHE